MMEFMHLRDLAHMMAVDTRTMVLIKEEAQPIAILTVIPRVRPDCTIHYSTVRYFVPQQTPINMVIELIKQDYPETVDDEYIFTDLMWYPLESTMRDGPVSKLRQLTMFVQYIIPSRWMHRKWRETEHAWCIRQETSRSRRQARQRRHLTQVQARYTHTYEQSVVHLHCTRETDLDVSTVMVLPGHPSACAAGPIYQASQMMFSLTGTSGRWAASAGRVGGGRISYKDIDDDGIDIASSSSTSSSSSSNNSSSSRSHSSSSSNA
jgi:hypothetical protein